MTLYVCDTYCGQFYFTFDPGQPNSIIYSGWSPNTLEPTPYVACDASDELAAAVLAFEFAPLRWLSPDLKIEVDRNDEVVAIDGVIKAEYIRGLIQGVCVSDYDMDYIVGKQ